MNLTFGNRKERIQIILKHICFSTIEEINYGRKVIKFHPSHINQWVSMLVLLQQALEE